jgi:hypothetical protein
MEPHCHRVFTSAGFYNSEHHIVLLPGPNPHEAVVHEATHANLVARSSLGFLQQVISFVRRMEFEPGFDAIREQIEPPIKQIIEIIDQATVQVHEATAWLVSETAYASEATAWLVSEIGSGAPGPERPTRAPQAYRKGVHVLRRSLEAMPQKPFLRLEDCIDDFDPLWRGPNLLAQAVACFALSPPFVTQLVRSPTGDCAARLRAEFAKKDQHPLSRFLMLLRQLKVTPFPVAKEWTTWVTRWQFNPSEPAPVQLERGGLFARLIDRLSGMVPDLGHSGYIRWEVDNADIGRLLYILCQELYDEKFLLDAWERTWRLSVYDPHVDPYFQTCIFQRPKRLRVRTYDGDHPPDRLLNTLFDLAHYVIVTQGLEDTFSSRLEKDGRLLIRFESYAREVSLLWKVSRKRARSFLQSWTHHGKGITTSSYAYDFSACDFEQPGLLHDIPHAVVAVSDLRSVWWRLTLSGRDGFRGSKEIKVACLAAENAPEYVYLLFKSEHRFPLLILPCLFTTYRRHRDLCEEIQSPPEFKLIMAQEGDAEIWVEQCGASAYAAIDSVKEYFRQDDA